MATPNYLGIPVNTGKKEPQESAKEEYQRLLNEQLRQEMYERDYVRRQTGYTPEELKQLELKHALQDMYSSQSPAPQGTATAYQGVGPGGSAMLTDQPQAGFTQQTYRTGGDFTPGQAAPAQAGGRGGFQAAIMAAVQGGQLDPNVANTMLQQATPKQPKQSDIIKQEKFQRDQKYRQTLGQIRQMERAVADDPELKESIQPALDKLENQLTLIDPERAASALKKEETKAPRLNRDIAIQIAQQGPEWARQQYGTDYGLTQQQAAELANAYTFGVGGEGEGLETPPEPGQASQPQQASAPIEQRMQAEETPAPAITSAPTAEVPRPDAGVSPTLGALPQNPEDYINEVLKANPGISPEAAKVFVLRKYQASDAGAHVGAPRG